MSELERAAEIAATRARLAVLEQGIPKTPPSKPGDRRVGFLLFLGVFVLPYLFAWLLLRTGYSNRARAVGIGWLAIMAAVVAGHAGQLTPAVTATDAAPIDPDHQAKYSATVLAKLAVPTAMKDPDSARFGRVWGMSANVACGFVSGKNGFGALTGEQRFIYTAGAVEFEGATGFNRHWNAICVDKLLSTPPAAVAGVRWGASPSSALKLYSPASKGLAIYVPRSTPAALEGVPVKEADYRFDHGRFYAADLYIDGADNRDAIKTALAKRYGTPTSYGEPASSYSWAWPDRHVSVEMTYEAKQNRTTVTIARGEH